MNGIDITPYQHLPLIIGDNAPGHIKELMTILAVEPQLTKHFSAAIRVSDRRWNIRLNLKAGSDVEIRLPENNPAEAWKRLADAQSREQILDRDIKVIDLRLEGKMFIKLAPEENQPKTSNARET
jgi:cell division protein FtsQ